MESARLEALVLRLVQNPHDEGAIGEAHAEGQRDPKAYAVFLERVGAATSDPALASYWLTEASTVWQSALGDVHRAARTLMLAIDRDPMQPVPAERLAELYRQKGDSKALAALLERRAKALLPMAAVDVPVREQLAGIYEELGRLWAEPPLASAEKAIEHFRRALEYDTDNEYAIYTLRELLKAQGALSDALPLYERERALTQDGERKLALFGDEGEVRQRLGDWAGAAEAFKRALSLDPNDPTTRQQLATLVLERARAGQAPSAIEVEESVGLFIGLAEEFGGEHGFLYALCALELVPGHDRALELALQVGEQLGRMAEVAQPATAYLQANPRGRMAAQAQQLAAAAAPPAKPAAPASTRQGPPPKPAIPPAVVGVSAAGAHDADTVIGEAAIDEIRRAAAATGDPVPQQPPAAAPAPAARAPAAAVTPQAPAAVQSPLEALLSQAATLAAKNRKNEAYKFYREALDLSPAEPEALAFVETHLKRIRKFSELRDLLWVAAKAAGPGEPATTWLKEVATLCETQLRDLEGAIAAWHAIHEYDPETARVDLKRLLVQGSRWDVLAGVLAQEAELAADPEARISLEKDLARLHEEKRGDANSAAECWARIAGLTSGEAEPIWRAVSLYEQAGLLNQAASTISLHIQSIRNPGTLSDLYRKLGGLREAMGDLSGAGEALREGALEARRDDLWELSEGYFVRAQNWEQAAAVVHERAQAAEGKAQAALLARESGYNLNAGDRAGAVTLLERASEIDPENAEIAGLLEQMFMESGQNRELVQYLLRRAEGLNDKDARVDLRHRAAGIQRNMGDRDGARESLELILLDREDAAVLTELAQEAEERGEADRAVDYYKRLADNTDDKERRAQMILRQAKLLIDPLGELEGAVDCYRTILTEIDPGNRDALKQVAELELQRGEAASAASAFEALLKLTEAKEEQLEIAQRLIALYDKDLDQEQQALMRTLELVHELDPDDFETIGRLSELSEQLDNWAAYVKYQSELISVEGDEAEISRMTLRVAEVLREKLDQAEEALNRLGQAGDSGDSECRHAFVALGDELGKQSEVARRLVTWYKDSAGSPERTSALHDAFERLVTAGADAEAASVAKDLARTRVADPAIGQRLEEVAVRLKDLDALAIAHGLLVRNLSGTERAEEMVRQAEGLARAGVDVQEAALHGEQALTSVEPSEVEGLLGRLAKLVGQPSGVVDVYERQVGRCKNASDRLKALARAAQVAAELELLERARGFFDLALDGGDPEAVEVLERAARERDEAAGDKKLTTRLAEALADGGQGVRDAGRTRAALLRRAASMALYELDDKERGFRWIGDSLVAHVTDDTLEVLIDMGRSEGDFKQVETVLSRALEEVHDGPLVRKLLGTRGRLRRDEISDVRGAAEDLKRLHDLSPGDSDLMTELSALYTALEDYRGMVQLYEDQILRSKDQSLRAELAREVALLWRDKLDDPRETADAWRRVLRLQPGNPEATEGLTAAKQAMLKHKPAAPAAAQEAAAEAAAAAAAEAAAAEAAAAEAAGPVAEETPPPSASDELATLAPPMSESVAPQEAGSDAASGGDEAASEPPESGMLGQDSEANPSEEAVADTERTSEPPAADHPPESRGSRKKRRRAQI